MSSLIRRETVATRPRFSFNDLEREGRRVLEEAREQALQIVAEAERLAAQRLAEDRRRGYQTGLAEGKEAGRAQVLSETREAARQAAVSAARGQVDQLGKALAEALGAFEREKRTLIATAESGLVELAMAIARRVCKHIAAEDSAAAMANARALLDMVKHENDVALHFHPDDHARLADVASDIIAAAAGHQHVTLVADATVPPGGCVLRGASVVVDGTIETQLDRIAAAICGAGSTA